MPHKLLHSLMLSPCLPHWPVCSSSLCVMAR